MQFTSLFVSLLLSTAVVAKDGNKTKPVTDKAMCREMAKLTHLVSFAANDTMLAQKTKNNATKIATIKEKAVAAQTELTSMNSNATLVSTCAVISASEAVKHGCKKMAKLEKFVATAANETKLAQKTKNNATKIANFKMEAAAAQTQLTDMKANTTLVNECATLATSKKASKAEAQKAAAASTSSTPSATPSAVMKSGASSLNAGVGLLSTILIVAAGVAVL